MRTFLLLSCLVGLVACDSLTDPRPFRGNEVGELPFRLKTRTYPAWRQGVRYPATATYHYDSLGRLARVDSAWTDRHLLYHYVGDQLRERLTVSVADGRVIFRETFAYNARGQLTQKQWTSNGSVWQYRYAYDAAGQLVTEVTTFAAGNYTRTAHYGWQNGNVVARTMLDEKGQKNSEWAYRYDRQPNYRALVPADPDDPFAQTRHNRVETRLVRDYSGLIDLCVNPALNRYRYNASGLPVRQDGNCDVVNQWQAFSYERKP